MRSAIVHDWLISEVGGAEKVVKAIHQLYPSPIFTLVKNNQKLKGSYFEDLEIISSFLQKFPKAEKKYQSYLPFFPLAIEHFDLSKFDCVISSSHCVAKGVITSPDHLHICYCHTPMRYAWDLMHDYLRDAKLDKGIKGFFAKVILHYLRGWDTHSSNRVDHFVANSNYVAKRIAKFYGREATVIYPPVDVDLFELVPKKENYYLAASRLVPYKRIDLIVEAFTKMEDKKLVVIGDGPEMKKLKQISGKNVELLGYQSDAVLKMHMQKAKGFVFAAIEDFGILPVEVMATGTPVIAFGKGGALETVVENKTGIFYEEQTSFAIMNAIKRFEELEFDPRECRKRAEFFSLERFKREFSQFVERGLEKK